MLQLYRIVLAVWAILALGSVARAVHDDDASTTQLEMVELCRAEFRAKRLHDMRIGRSDERTLWNEYLKSIEAREAGGVAECPVELLDQFKLETAVHQSRIVGRQDDDACKSEARAEVLCDWMSAFRVNRRSQHHLGAEKHWCKEYHQTRMAREQGGENEQPLECDRVVYNSARFAAQHDVFIKFHGNPGEFLGGDAIRPLVDVKPAPKRSIFASLLG